MLKLIKHHKRDGKNCNDGYNRQIIDSPTYSQPCYASKVGDADWVYTIRFENHSVEMDAESARQIIRVLSSSLELHAPDFFSKSDKPTNA